MRSIILAIIGAGMIGGAVPREVRAQRSLSEYEVKAAFLYNFAAFVEWPDSSATRPVRIGIVSLDPPRELLQVLRGRTIGGRALELHVFSVDERIVPTDILFITADADTRLNTIVNQLKGLPVLIVGESEGFARHGGMVNFYVESSRVRFEINRAAAEAVGLRLSSQLLRVARLVAGGEE